MISPVLVMPVSIFRAWGNPITLILHSHALAEQALPDGDITINTESRFLTPQKAATRISLVVGLCRAAGYEAFYKKIDSTMRGNPGAEIEAALEATGHAAALICTAMPETGRSCINGEIYLDGIGLHETEIGQDPFHPIASSDITAMLREQSGLPIGKLTISDIEAGGTWLQEKIAGLIKQGVKLIVADATHERHLEILARQVLTGDFLAVGAGGFARALAIVQKTRVPNGVSIGNRVVNRPLLCVVGSLNRNSLRQAEQAEASGLYQTIILPLDVPPAQIPDMCQSQLADSRTGTKNILLRMEESDRPERIRAEDGAHIASLLGKAALAICDLVHCRTIFSTGGETSIAVADALGIGAIALEDELMPGVVLGACKSTGSTVKWFISKAGGFGDEHVLSDIAAFGSGRCAG